MTVANREREQMSVGRLCSCGLPMSKNPHPDAGKSNVNGVAVGYAYECIHCLIATRNRVGASWREAQAENERLRRWLLRLSHTRASSNTDGEVRALAQAALDGEVCLWVGR